VAPRFRGEREPSLCAVALVQFMMQTHISELEVSLQKKRMISIVDDDQSAREGLIDLVKSMGFVAESFQSAGDFLNSSHLHDTSCLIADVQMPEVTGIELYKRLVQSGNLVPTVLITAFPNARDRAFALQTGVTCYLVKPFNDDDLFECIRSALESRKDEGCN
jgi:FixJ family two-component response regulator